MIRRLLIANRGEIAVRIARTCRRLGIATVAVYSDADGRALHVAAADVARRIGPAEPARSYLDGAALIDAARAMGADSIHPGYGFLSESADFAEACGRAGLVFVGPRPEAIRAMGSKERSRELATRLGVPIVAGYQGAAQDDATLLGEGERIGYPLLVKASAGGGGKGIRLVEARDALAAALAAARREAYSAFGDATLVLERFLERARHVEVQVLGDRHGRRVPLFDRECSIQRNHQKLIEEAPAPRLPEGLRGGLRDAALRIAEAIDYDSAGTAEFLVDDAAQAFFFLEMNTRLQVEHPTTELVTGLDLVELQIRVASGEPLPEGIAALEPRGSAIEARICAERPERGFLPATGTIRRFEVPAIEGVRVDAGIASGSVVTAYYDSMLAKVIAHGRDREEARRRLAAALGGTVLAGVESNVDFLRGVLESPQFVAAKISTRFLEEHFLGAERLALAAGDEIDLVAAALAWVLRLEDAGRGGVPPWNRLGAWRVTGRSGHAGGTSIVLREGEGEPTEVRVGGVGGRYEVDVGSGARPVATWRNGEGLHLEIGGTLHRRIVEIEGSALWVSGGERHRRFARPSREEQIEKKESATRGDPRNLVAPFPGLVTSVEVSPGDTVESGGLLVVMEAMKMVHSLRASGAGAVRAVRCEPGRTVAAGELLVEMEGGSP